MNCINKVILVGELGKDAEILSNNKREKLLLTLVTSHKNMNLNGESEVKQWHKVVTTINVDYAKTLKKKDRVMVEGEIVYKSFDRGNGEKQYITEISATSITCINKAL